MHAPSFLRDDTPQLVAICPSSSRSFPTTRGNLHPRYCHPRLRHYIDRRVSTIPVRHTYCFSSASSPELSPPPATTTRLVLAALHKSTSNKSCSQLASSTPQRVSHHLLQQGYRLIGLLCTCPRGSPNLLLSHAQRPGHNSHHDISRTLSDAD